MFLGHTGAPYDVGVKTNALYFYIIFISVCSRMVSDMRPGVLSNLLKTKKENKCNNRVQM